MEKGNPCAEADYYYSCRQQIGLSSKHGRIMTSRSKLWQCDVIVTMVFAIAVMRSRNRIGLNQFPRQPRCYVFGLFGRCRGRFREAQHVRERRMTDNTWTTVRRRRLLYVTVHRVSS